MVSWGGPELIDHWEPHACRISLSLVSLDPSNNSRLVLPSYGGWFRLSSAGVFYLCQAPIRGWHWSESIPEEIGAIAAEEAACSHWTLICNNNSRAYCPLRFMSQQLSNSFGALAQQTAPTMIEKKHTACLPHAPNISYSYFSKPLPPLLFL